MNVKSFASNIKRINQSNRWILLLIAYAIIMFAGVPEEVTGASVAESHGNVGYYMIPVIISILCAIAFYDKYLKTSVHFSDRATYLRESIAEYMKFHGFAQKEYFTYIMKRFLPVQGFMLVWGILMAMAEQDCTKAIAGVIAGAVPFAVWQIKRALFHYEMTHLVRGWKVLVMGGGEALLFIISIVLAYLSLIIGFLVSYAFLESLVIPLDEQSVAISFEQGVHWLLMVGVVLVPAIFFFHAKWIKTYHVKVIAVGVLVILCGISLYCNAANHIIIEEEHITVVRNLRESNYDFDDVKAFEVFREGGAQSIAIRFFFANGETVAVAMNDYSNTDKWSEGYENEYAYIEDVVMRLLQQGAEGSIRDTEKLLEDVKEMEHYEKPEKTLKEIIVMLP